jgi:hypothetical protein
VNRWGQLSFEAKSAVAMLAVVLVGVAGFFAAAGLAGLVEPASVATDERQVVVDTVMVERTVVRRVRVVQRVTEPSGVLAKQAELLTVTLPVVRKSLVTVTGPQRTVIETRDGTTLSRVVTSERVVTRERVVTNQRVQTVVRPVTTTRVVTETVPVTQTVRSTDTVRVTETAQPVQVTVDRPVTVTVTVPPKKP